MSQHTPRFHFKSCDWIGCAGCLPVEICTRCLGTGYVLTRSQLRIECSRCQGTGKARAAIALAKGESQ